MTVSKNEEKKQAILTKNDREVGDNDWDDEAWQNWIGFWDLLLKEDMRQNPHLYKKNRRDDFT